MNVGIGTKAAQNYLCSVGSALRQAGAALPLTHNLATAHPPPPILAALKSDQRREF